MFTGLCETTAAVAKSDKAKLALEVPAIDPREYRLGESISVSGVCLTLTRVEGRGFEADVSVETLAVTTLGALRPGSRVNIERSLRLGDRLGGHVVLGHVDGVGEVRAVEPAGDARKVTVAAPAELRRFIAAKGSIALDGVSLTVNRAGDGDFELMLVPHTLEVTTLKDWRAGQKVNIEVDVLARYVGRQLEASGDERLLAKLRAGGFLS